jgi:hypothetical protein
MSKRLIFNFRAMTNGELRTFIKQCNKEEPLMKAPYAKGRRGLKQKRAEAQDELRRRGIEA